MAQSYEEASKIPNLFEYFQARVSPAKVKVANKRTKYRGNSKFFLIIGSKFSEGLSCERNEKREMSEDSFAKVVLE
jgi:hypothetical protein